MKATLHITMILLPLINYAQSGITPLPLLKLRDNYTFDNPAAAVLTESAELKIIPGAYTGLAGNVGLNYLEGSFTVKSNSKNNAQIPGLLIHSEYETDILKRTRVYLRYSWNTKISENIKISAGIHAGFFNYSVKSSNSSAGLSAFTPDANLGLWLHSKRVNLGISSPQILNSKIRPINTPYTLNRYLNLLADYKLFSSPNSELTAGAKFYSNGMEYKGVTAALILQLKTNFSTEVNYSLNKGFAFSAGIVQFPLLSLKGDLFFSYFNSIGVNNLNNNNRVEISMRLYFTKNTSTEI